MGHKAIEHLQEDLKKIQQDAKVTHKAIQFRHILLLSDLAHDLGVLSTEELVINIVRCRKWVVKYYKEKFNRAPEF